MKKAQVIWSDEALNDLEIIYDFMADKSQAAAQRIVESILDRSRQLEVFPISGARQKNIKGKSKEYRYLVEGNYKIIYSHHPESQVVHVEIIFDARSNPENLKT